ncbi:ribonuclease T [Qipengyuania sp. JC766]|uniref:ribonuclease T2 family protein n=1 Tax=Qipengyuania sp. JC766 TaxID=3232139 RepID=UPI003458C2C5
MKGIALAVPLALVFAGSAQAQSYQCRFARTVAIPEIRPDGPPRQVRITGYTLALSWSPEFCKGRETDARHRSQCSGRNGRFGFVTHGLWPEGAGGWPQWCPTRANVTPAIARRNLCLSPSVPLIARQWAKHGSCMARTPREYFTTARILRSFIAFPDTDRLSREDDLTAGRLREAFASANPWWPQDAVGLKVNRRGWLQEMRLCYDSLMRPKTCDRRRFGPSDGARIRIWRGL